jgi:hypothetical protein
MLDISLELLRGMTLGVKTAAAAPATIRPRFSAGALARNAATEFKPLPSVAHLRTGGPPPVLPPDVAAAVRRRATEPAPRMPAGMSPADQVALERSRFRKKTAASSMVIHGMRLGARFAKKRRFPQGLAKKAAFAVLAAKLANITSARAQLAQGARRSKLKMTVSGPSVQQLAKPRGFGLSIPGANKGGAF